MIKNNKAVGVTVWFLRVGLGWLFFYAGITKVINSAWSAAGYLGAAKTFPAFFSWLTTPANIPWVNFANEWGLTLIGLGLITGLLVRPAAIAGIALMFLYYLPILDFPYPNPHSYLVDEHIIYILVLALLFNTDAGRFWGLDKMVFKRKYN